MPKVKKKTRRFTKKEIMDRFGKFKVGKRIDGKRFYLDGAFPTKSGATGWKEKQKESGYRARIKKTSKGYIVYTNAPLHARYIKF